MSGLTKVYTLSTKSTDYKIDVYDTNLNRIDYTINGFTGVISTKTGIGVGTATRNSSQDTTTGGTYFIEYPLIFQWGKHYIQSELKKTTGVSSTVTFPISYTYTWTYVPICTPKNANSGGVGGSEISIYNVPVTGFTFYLYNRNSSTAITSPGVYWYSIGW